MSNDKMINDFALNAKFKTSGTGAFTYFNPSETKQIRIYKPEYKNVKCWRVTLHTLSDDNITYGDYEVNYLCTSLKEAKQYAGKIYFSLQ